MTTSGGGRVTMTSYRGGGRTQEELCVGGWRGVGGGMPGTWLRLLVVLTGCLTVTPQSNLPRHLQIKDAVREYCEREVFNATCGPDEVVIIQSARYGRMREGRCITSNYGTVGCSNNVLSHLDMQCSGRQKCIGSVGVLMPLSIQPCPGDFRSYLEASYICAKVASNGGNPKLCQSSSHVAIRNQEGFLSNYITETSRLGSLDCPWLIEMSPGQTIKLTLLDFGSRSGRDENICHVYATIKEAAASTSETVCASRHRSTLVYTSSTNVVEVRLVSKRQDDEKSGFYFLIKYEAVGCADPKKPTHGLLERRGDVVTVGCIYGEERWVLKCDGHTWTGNRGNCTGGNGLGTDNNTMWGKINFPSGLSIILIMCIALFIGIVILTVGLLCLKRRHLGSNQAEQPTKVEHGPDVYNSYRRTSPRQHSMTSPGDPGGQPPSHNPQPHPQQHTFPRVGHLPKPPNSPFDNQPENDYSRTWQMQRHPGVGSTRNPLPLPPGTGYGVDPRGGAGYGGNNNHRNAANYDQHVYESPKFERHELNSGSDEGSYSEHVPGSAQYYELDPEAVPLDCGPAPVHSMRDVMGTALEEQRLVSRNPLTPHMGK